MAAAKDSTHVRGNMLYARMHRKSRLAKEAPIPSRAQATGKRGGFHATITKQLRKLSQGL